MPIIKPHHKQEFHLGSFLWKDVIILFSKFKGLKTRTSKYSGADEEVSKIFMSIMKPMKENTF